MSLYWSIVIGAAGAIAIVELISISLNVSAMRSTLDEIRDYLRVIEATPTATMVPTTTSSRLA
jgi:hypothetical protein